MLETHEELEAHEALARPPLARNLPGAASAPAISGAIAHARIEDVRLDLIRVEERSQLRQRLREAKVREFERSLTENGLIHPILVAREGPRYVLVLGAYRLEAAKRLGWPAIRALVLESVEGNQALQVALTENLVRVPLSRSETALACHRLSRGLGWTHERISEVLGPGPKTIQRLIRIVEEGAPAVLQAFDEGKINQTKALAIVRVPREKRAALVEEVLARRWKQEDLESRVRELRHEGNVEKEAKVEGLLGALPVPARLFRTNHVGLSRGAGSGTARSSRSAARAGRKRKWRTTSSNALGRSIARVSGCSTRSCRT